MKRIGFLVMIVGLFTVLTGCQSDQKQATEIHEKMETSASFEEKFVTNQKNMAEERKKLLMVYKDVLDTECTDTGVLKQKLSDQEITKEQQQLNEVEENFQNAYSKLMSIDENVGLIKDEKQKKQAAKLMSLMKDRKKLMDTYFDTYQNQLNSQTTFFKNLKQGEFELDTLQNQIHTINQDSQKMTDVVEKFNKVTKEFNKVENDYFKMADLG